MTHDESIALIKSLGAKFTPELKAPEVPMPFDGDYTQEKYASQMLDAYKKAGIPPSDVFAQSFNLNDVLCWVKTEPDFGKQAVYLEDRYEKQGLDPNKPETWKPSMAGVEGLEASRSSARRSDHADAERQERNRPVRLRQGSKAAGLDLIGWSLERDGPLHKGGGFYPPVSQSGRSTATATR